MYRVNAVDLRHREIAGWELHVFEACDIRPGDILVAPDGLHEVATVGVGDYYTHDDGVVINLGEVHVASCSHAVVYRRKQ